LSKIKSHETIRIAKGLKAGSHLSKFQPVKRPTLSNSVSTSSFGVMRSFVPKMKALTSDGRSSSMLERPSTANK